MLSVSFSNDAITHQIYNTEMTQYCHNTSKLSHMDANGFPNVTVATEHHVTQTFPKIQPSSFYSQRE